jgi:hypothetical protein
VDSSYHSLTLCWFHVIKTAEEPLIGETIYAIVRELYHPVDLNWIKIRLVSNLIAKLTALPTSALRKSPGRVARSSISREIQRGEWRLLDFFSREGSPQQTGCDSCAGDGYRSKVGACQGQWVLPITGEQRQGRQA